MTTTKSGNYVHHRVMGGHGTDSTGRLVKVTDSAVIAGRMTGVNVCVGLDESKMWGVTMTRKETRLLLAYIVRSYLRSIKRDVRRKNYRRIYAKVRR